MSSLDYDCFHCKGPVDDNLRCYKCACRRCGSKIRDGICKWCEANPNAFNDSQNSSDYPSQPEIRAINGKPSRLDPHLSRFTVTKKNDLPNSHVYQEQEPGIITEVVEIASSKSTPLVPPPDFSKCSSRLDNHSDYCVDSLNGSIPSLRQSFIPCVGCGEPLFGLPCRWCTCERCGNDIQNGSCLFCGSRNSFAYDSNPRFCNDPQNDFVSYEHNPCYQNFNVTSFQNAPTSQQYGCEYCGGPHFSTDCQTRNLFPCDNNYHDQPPQYQTFETQPQPFPQELLQNVINTLNDLKDLVNKPAPEEPRPKSYRETLAEEAEEAARVRSRMRNTFIYDDDDDDEDSIQMKEYYEGLSIETPSIQKSQGEKTMMELLAEEQMKFVKTMYASSSQLPQSVVITPEVHTHSPNMGDEHLSTVPEKESDEFIKSSVENLVPIPGESQGTFDQMCDLPSPLECPKDQFETFSDLSDDCTFYGDIEYVEASLPHSDVDPFLEEFADELTHINPIPTGSDDDLFDFETDLGEIENLLYHDLSLNSYPNSPMENVNHLVSETFKTTFTNPLFEFEYEFTLISDNPIFDVQNEDGDESTTEQEFTDLHHVIDSLHEEFSGELTHIMTPLEYDYLDNKKNHSVGEKFSIMRIGILMTNFPTLPPKMLSNPKSLTYEIQNQETEPDLEGEDVVMIIIMTFFLAS